MGSKIVFAIVVVAQLLISASVWAVPDTINYQGKLTDSGGGLLTGTYGMRFYLCDEPAGGNCDWSEEQHVEVKDGIFNVLLGNTDPIPTAIFETDPLYLEVQINTGSEWEVLSPRQPLTSVGYAFTANTALNVANNVITSMMIQDGTISLEDVNFNYAGSTSKGGPATDLVCTGCVSESELDFTPLVREIDPQVGTLSLGKWCTSDGDVINCTENAPSASSWNLTGNAGTNPMDNFLGTTDNQPFEIRVANIRGLRIERHSTTPSLSPNIIGGDLSNGIVPDVIGSTIGGGGEPGSENAITDNFGTIGGGKGNMAGDDAGTNIDASHATIGGGRDNKAQGIYTTIGGGWGNQIIAEYGTVGGGGEFIPGDPTTANLVTDDYGTIGGGGGNQAGDDAGTTEDAHFATVSGGLHNIASGSSTTVGGGKDNWAYGRSAIVGGGEGNIAGGENSTVGGGYSNWAIESATIGGGYVNHSLGYASTVCGGAGNRVTDDYGTIAGGGGNQAGDDTGTKADATYATVGGGYNNIASSEYSTIGGGYNNIASSEYTTVGGGLNNTVNRDDATVGGGESNTAVGLASTVCGGWDNTATGSLATVGGGWQNTASGIDATIPGGVGAVASHYGQMAYASGRFSNSGDAQASLYVLRNVTTDTTSPTELFLNGTSQRIAIESGRTMIFDILIVGRSDNGNSAGYKCYGVVENDGGNVINLGTTHQTLVEEADWTVNCGTENNALVVKVTGDNSVIRWVATVRTAEVAWP